MKNDLNISGILADTEKLKDANIELEASLKKLQDTQEKMASGSEKFSRAYQDNAVVLRKAEAALKGNNEQIDKNIKMLDMGKASLEKNKALLESLKDRYVALTSSQGDQAVGASKLNTQIALLSKTVADQETKLEKNRKIFDTHEKSTKALSSAFETLKTSTTKYVEENPQFATTLDDAAAGFNAMKTGLSAIQTGFKSVGSAIKTTGFGLLVLVLQSLVEYFTTNTEGLKKLHGAMAVVEKVVTAVKNGFAGMGEIMVNAFSHPMQSLEKIGTFLKDNLLNRLKAIGVILDGIIHLDFKKIGDGLIQSVSGVTNATDKIKTAYNKTKDAIVAGGKDIVETYKKGVEESGKAAKSQEQLDKEKEERLAQQQRKQEERQLKQAEAVERAKQKHAADVKDMKAADQALNDLEAQTQARNAQKVLTQYDNDVKAIKDFYTEKLGAYEKFIKDYEEKAANDPEYKKLNAHGYDKAQTAVVILKTNEAKELETLSDNFQQNELNKLTTYENKLNDITANAKKTARELAIAQIDEKYKAEEDAIAKALAESKQRVVNLRDSDDPLKQEKLNKETAIQNQANSASAALDNQKTKDKDNVKSDFEIKDTQESITENEANGHHNTALTRQLALLTLQHDAAVKAAEDTGKATTAIDENYAKKKAAIEDQLAQAKIHAGDKFIDAVLKNSKKDSAIYKAAFMAKKATSIADTIISTKRAVLESLKAYSGIPFIGQALGIAQAAFMAGQGAMSIAEIAKQKPGFAAGGRFVSDGRGALLPGYSRTDNTNAHLRSGEAVVVSEAMRNPWARNLVSAINVAHGGRDFSAPNNGHGYAIGGIFTDGGNANRYYNQPVNDIKDMANTLAYQMINNFPPIYVDVKDVNNQQNILAQTVNRVNL